MNRMLRCSAALLAAGALASPACVWGQWNPTEGLVLTGTVVTMDADSRVLEGGSVWLRNGRIAALAARGEALPAAAEKAIRIDTKGYIYPGLIDLHNHPDYAAYPLLKISTPYRDRYQWRFYDPGLESYENKIATPHKALVATHGTELSIYGELAALVGGTTSMQGGYPLNPVVREECLVRNIEFTQLGGSTKRVFSQLDIAKSAEEWKSHAMEMQEAGAWILHLGEGLPRQDPYRWLAWQEFGWLKASKMVTDRLVAIHGVALGADEIHELAAAKGKLVWSPLSNFLLYQQTANIRAAVNEKVTLSLAPDWAPSGSKSLLGELKIADIHNKGSALFTDQDLVAMGTRNPASAIGWSGQLGSIAMPGDHQMHADVIVVDAIDKDPYRNLIRATEDSIALVVVRGEPLYGNTTLMSKLRKRTIPGPQRRAVEEYETMPGKPDKAVVLKCGAYWGGDQSVAGLVSRLDTGLRTSDAKVPLRPLYTRADREFFDRLMATPHLPPEYKKLEDLYYK
jgi:5-methylthioadenosine/S-adenosylhomocysteine deaminase